MESISTRGRWSRREFFRSFRQAYRFNKGDAIFIVAFVSIGLIANRLLFAVIFAIIWGVLMNTYLGPLLLWIVKKRTREERTTTFSDEGILIVGSTFTWRADWSEYATSKETKDFYILRPPPWVMKYTPIRKTAFANESDESRFREMLRAHTTASLRKNPELDRPSTIG
jgi:hypothetical protein